jgi:hypothetical protein
MVKSPLFFADSPTLAVSRDWIETPRDVLVKRVTTAIELFNAGSDMPVGFVSLSVDGQIVVEFTMTPPASIRGSILLDLEDFLKLHLDVGITIWHKALGDKNSLRKLRGIEVK